MPPPEGSPGKRETPGLLKKQMSHSTLNAKGGVVTRAKALAEEAERKAREAQRKLEEQQKAALNNLDGNLNFAAMLQAAKFAQQRTIDALHTDEPADEIPEVKGASGRLYGGFALCGLRPKHWPRKQAILFVEWPTFDKVILLTILCNCATMAWVSPLDPLGTPKAAFIDVCEWVFLAIFTCELLIKMVAYGLIFHAEAYLRDPWCQLDFVVVTLAWLPILIPSFGNYSVFRAFRALRPLRALKRVPGMPLLVQWILDVLPKMGNVLMLCGFIFLVFGIVGMELFKGVLHYRCALPGFVETPGHPLGARLRMLKGVAAVVADGDDPQVPFDTEVSCMPELEAEQCAGLGSIGCKYFDSTPNHGLISFDSVPDAFIALMEAITFDDWAEPMLALEGAFSDQVWVYFVLMVIFGGFFIVNLFLAVIFLEFATSRGNMMAADAQEKLEAEKKAEAEASGEAGKAGGDADDEEENEEEEQELAEAVKAAEAAKRGSKEGGEGDKDADSPSKPLLNLSAVRSDAQGGHRTPPVVSIDDRGPSTKRRRALSQRGRGCCDCAPPETGCRAAFAAFAVGGLLGNVSLGLVLVNMVIMCMPYWGMSAEYEAGLESAATAISWAFIVEMAIKVFGLGCAGYWSDGWNVLDGSIVTMSIVEMVLTALASGTGVKLSFLRMLRMLRVLRMLRLMRKWRGLYRIVTTFIRAMPQMANLVFLIVLTMFIFSLLGMQIVGGIYNPETGYAVEPCHTYPGHLCPEGLVEKPHYHFDYISPAMTTVFILLTGEWVDAMEPAVAIEGKSVVFFFIAIVIVGKYLLINLLVAVILTEFAEGPGSSGSKNTPREGTDGEDTARTARDTARSEASVSSRYTAEAERGSRRSSRESAQGSVRFPEDEPEEVYWPRDYSLCLFAPANPLRRMVKSLVTHPAFDRVIILAIIASSACLAMDTPRLNPESELAANLRSLDLFFTCLFFTEMSLKIISFGFACAEGTYLTSPWNQLDFCIVMVSLVVLLAEQFPQLRPLRILRVLRVLRPLRLISRNAGMKLIITSLFKTLPAVTNVFGVILMTQLVFAILGMQLFSGALASCSDSSIMLASECEGPGLLWANPRIGSFDNFGDAMRLLYVMSSGDQWELPMYEMMGSSEPGVAPRRNDYSPYALFPITWMFFGFVFAINLFVGVVVDNFSRIQKEENGSAIMTQEQMQWASTMKAMVKKMPLKAVRPPSNPIRLLLYRFINSRGFDGFITGVIIANVFVMSCDYHGIEQDANQHYYDVAMTAFSMIYYVEATLKLIGMGPNGYFSDNWCRFDFFLVCTSLLDQFASDVLEQIMPLPPMLLRVLRVLRILRILRLLKGAKELRDLIVTMVLSFPSLFNVGSLLALIMFIYSVLGVNLFTFVTHVHTQGGLTEHRNFNSVSSSFLLLFQCLTGDGWSAVMQDTMVSEVTGECSSEAGDCGSPAAIVYFITFQIIGSFVFLNLVVAVILENFSSLYNVDPDLVSTSDLEMFQEAWAELDPDATNYILVEKLSTLLLKLPPPLGLKGKTEQQARKLCMLLRVPQHEGGVAFAEVLKEIIENNYFHANRDKVDEAEFRGLVPMLRMPTLKLRHVQADEQAVIDELPRIMREAAETAQYFALRVISVHFSVGITNWRRRAAASSMKRKMKAAAKSVTNGAAKRAGNQRTASRSPKGSRAPISRERSRDRSGNAPSAAHGGDEGQMSLRCNDDGTIKISDAPSPSSTRVMGAGRLAGGRVAADGAVYVPNAGLPSYQRQGPGGGAPKAVPQGKRTSRPTSPVEGASPTEPSRSGNPPTGGSGSGAGAGAAISSSCPAVARKAASASRNRPAPDTIRTRAAACLDPSSGKATSVARRSPTSGGNSTASMGGSVLDNFSCAPLSPASKGRPTGQHRSQRGSGLPQRPQPGAAGAAGDLPRARPRSRSPPPTMSSGNIAGRPPQRQVQQIGAAKGARAPSPS